MSETGRVRFGVHPLLEAEADALLFAYLATITSQEEKKDVLTPWKEDNRLSREVYTAGGVVDPQIRRGIYGRIYNSTQTHLNSRDGSVPPSMGNKMDYDTLESLDGWQFR